MKPKVYECSVCGELIIPFMDSGQWCYDMVAYEGCRTHRGCMDQGRIWRRLRALESRVKELEDKNDEEKK